jgi:cell division protein FtsB
LNKAADIYWDNQETIRRNANRTAGGTRTDARARTAGPRWLSFALIASMTLMLCLSINYRAFTELHGEMNENKGLADQIQNLTDENLALQDEIHNLKTDPKTIEHEARKMGLGRSSEKSPVPAN